MALNTDEDKWILYTNSKTGHRVRDLSTQTDEIRVWGDGKQELESCDQFESCFYHYEMAGQLRIEVTDSGIGITREGISRLFQPFAQADKNISQQFGGTGLGLWLS